MISFFQCVTTYIIRLLVDEHLKRCIILKENSIYKKLTCITAGLDSYAII